MFRGRFLLVFAAVAILVSACGGPEKNVLGSWRGQYDLDQELIKSEMAKLTPEERTQVEAQLRSMTFTLELKKDMTYALTVGMQGVTGFATGSWYITDDGTRISLKPPQMDQEMRDQAREGGFLSSLLVGQELKVENDSTTLVGSVTNGGFLSGIKFSRS